MAGLTAHSRPLLCASREHGRGASTPPPAKLLGPRTCVHSGEQAHERSPTIVLKPFGAEEKMPSQMMTAGITCLRSRLQ